MLTLSEVLRRRVESSFGQYKNMKRIRELEGEVSAFEAQAAAVAVERARCGVDRVAERARQHRCRRQLRAMAEREIGAGWAGERQQTIARLDEDSRVAERLDRVDRLESIRPSTARGERAIAGAVHDAALLARQLGE